MLANIITTTKKRSSDVSGLRRSDRPKKRPEYYLKEVLIGRHNSLYFETDDIRGLHQPGSIVWSDKEIEYHRKTKEGKILFEQNLCNANWKWKHSSRGDGGYIYVAPNVPKREEQNNVNYFASYAAIYDQYEKDGKTIERILRRGAKHTKRNKHHIRITDRIQPDITKERDVEVQDTSNGNWNRPSSDGEKTTTDNGFQTPLQTVPNDTTDEDCKLVQVDAIDSTQTTAAIEEEDIFHGDTLVIDDNRTPTTISPDKDEIAHGNTTAMDDDETPTTTEEEDETLIHVDTIAIDNQAPTIINTQDDDTMEFDNTQPSQPLFTAEDNDNLVDVDETTAIDNDSEEDDEEIHPVETMAVANDSPTTKTSETMAIDNDEIPLTADEDDKLVHGDAMAMDDDEALMTMEEDDETPTATKEVLHGETSAVAVQNDQPPITSTEEDEQDDTAVHGDTITNDIDQTPVTTEEDTTAIDYDEPKATTEEDSDDETVDCNTTGIDQTPITTDEDANLAAYDETTAAFDNDHTPVATEEDEEEQIVHITTTAVGNYESPVTNEDNENIANGNRNTTTAIDNDNSPIVTVQYPTINDENSNHRSETCHDASTQLAIVSPDRTGEHKQTKVLEAHDDDVMCSVCISVPGVSINSSRRPANGRFIQKDEDNDDTFSNGLNTITPDEVIIPRLERIEYTLGLPENIYTHEKIYKRIAMLEDECGLQFDTPLTTTSQSSTFLQRVEGLESVIGLESAVGLNGNNQKKNIILSLPRLSKIWTSEQH